MDTEVIVAGAGPTGLVTALELARRGIGVRLLDAAPAPFAGSRGKGLQPRSLELLDVVGGVTDRLVALGRTHLPVRRYGPDGVVDEPARGKAPTPDTPWPSTLLVPQWRVEQVLRERLAEFGVAPEQGVGVEDLLVTADGVEVVTTAGTIGARHLVGADGGGSTVRRRLGVPFLGETREEIRMVVADVELEGLDREHWHQWGSPSGAPYSWVALCPLPATSTWQLQAGPLDDREPDESVLAEIVGARGPRVRLREVAWRSVWRLNVRMVADYRVGPVFLAGDAAHVHSPAGAQGMNTGIGDAMNLGWKLAAVLRGADAGLLDTYTAERLPIAAGVLGISAELSGGAMWARTAAQVRTTSQLDLSYRDGPLGGASEGPGPRPGDRAPDAPVGDSTLFLRRREADWTVLSTQDVEVAGAATVVVGDEAAATYALAPGEVVVIRPDGYVGCRATVSEARTWLAPLTARPGTARAA
ncbi:2-polyprenyl-6-methoxyphenol hydroxylase-like FAD-dependent oxidoreductase [Actinomycetospora succinea]|uniref:2-polyprenyl-6-methoxyphenol hydroxylase-like FAD-dependent oxidoreductase n=1 Tax=Actinomycetospora succinea TaxID=663603 RepID=A0A4R6VHF7_9PSEU|nr:FAD-dependent monooxygenase [Actinomycetospora succinea]TDQ60900.1 2-polyprenyl-6-methoxyphenol hydroxylase-like FAD-dependent oxidoreductase [Actinomycetospora succinea]